MIDKLRKALLLIQEHNRLHPNTKLSKKEKELKDKIVKLASKEVLKKHKKTLKKLRG